MENSLFPSADDELRAENEIKKLRLETEHGAVFGPVSDEVTPEMEKQWLDHIFHYEEMVKNAGRCTVFELIGSPEFKKASEIPDAEIDDAYEQLTALMNSKSVMLDALAEYEDLSRLLYTFITEELFHHEMDRYVMPGGFHCFIYEEFVPNHLYDLKNRLNELLEYIFNKRYPGEERFDNFVLNTSDMVPVDEKNVRKESVQLTEFLNTYPSRDVIMMTEPLFEYQLTEPADDEKNGGSGTARFEITWKATDKEGKYVSFSGSGIVRFDLDWGWWTIKHVAIPGLVIQ